MVDPATPLESKKRINIDKSSEKATKGANSYVKELFSARESVNSDRNDILNYKKEKLDYQEEYKSLQKNLKLLDQSIKKLLNTELNFSPKSYTVEANKYDCEDFNIVQVDQQDNKPIMVEENYMDQWENNTDNLPIIRVDYRIDPDMDHVRLDDFSQ